MRRQGWTRDAGVAEGEGGFGDVGRGGSELRGVDTHDADEQDDDHDKANQVHWEQWADSETVSSGVAISTG